MVGHGEYNSTSGFGKIISYYYYSTAIHNRNKSQFYLHAYRL